MNRSKRLLVIPCLSFFAGMLPNIAAAQNNAATALSTSFRQPNGSKAVSAAELITVAGTIQQAISTNASGLPRELHLVLAGSQGTINASVGPYLTVELKKILTAGQHVEVTGVARTWNGQSLLFVGKLSVNGHGYMLRNEQGFLIHPRESRAVRARQNQTVREGEPQ